MLLTGDIQPGLKEVYSIAGEDVETSATKYYRGCEVFTRYGVRGWGAEEGVVNSIGNRVSGSSSWKM